MLRQDVISAFSRTVVRISCMSSGCGAAIHSYMVAFVIRSRFILVVSKAGCPLM